MDYGQRIPVAAGIDVIFRNAGQILGSALLALLECLDSETQQLVFSNVHPLRDFGRQMVHDVAQSKTINHWKKPCIIMSPAGMGTVGRRRSGQTLEAEGKL